MASEDGNHQFLPDSPIRSVQEDEFRHQEYVDTLEQMVKTVEPPWNIGVFGEWGSGKTSIIKMLFSRLNESGEDFVCVEFDAWKHAEESLRADLLLNLDHSLGESTGQTVDGEPGILGEDRITQELYDVEERQKRVKDERSNLQALSEFFQDQKYVAGSIVGISLISLIAALLFNASVGAAVFTVIVAPLLLHMTKQLSDATDTLQRKFLYPRKEWSGAYEGLFEDIVAETDADKIVISIDNLDRCESETVYDVLVSLKTFLEKDRCIYIIPCDDKALQSHIESIDEEGEYFGEQTNEQEFLRKFFQTHLRIPQFIPEDIEEYAEAQNQTLSQPFEEDVIDVITKAYVKNPRRIKQSLNRLATLRMLADQIEDEGHLSEGTLTDNLPYLAKMAVLEEDHPQAYSAVQNDPGLLQDINEYFRGNLSGEDKERVQNLLAASDDPAGPESGLERFMRATLAYTVQNPRPFLRLGEPSYASDLASSDRLVQNLRTRNLEAVRDDLKQIEEGEQSFGPFVGALESALDEYYTGNRRGPLLSTMISTVSVYESFSSDRAQVAEVLGSYLVLDLAAQFYEDVDPKEFFSVLVDIPDADQRRVFNRFARSVTSGSSLRENVLEVFAENAEEIPSENAETLCGELMRLDSDFESALQILASNQESRRLATPDLLKQAAMLTTWENRQNDFVDTEHYLQFDTEAKPRSRKHYVKQLLELEREPDDDNNGLNRYYRQLSTQLTDLEGQVDRTTGTELFNALKQGVESNNGNELELMKNMIFFYQSYEAPTREEFATWIADRITSWNQGQIQQVFNHAQNVDVNLFGDEEVVETVVSEIPNRINNSNFITSTVIPQLNNKKHKELLIDLLERLSTSDTDEQIILAAEIFAEHPARFGAIQDDLLERFRKQFNSTNNVNHKEAYLQAQLVVFDDLDAAGQEAVITQLTSLLSGNRNEHQSFKSLWQDLKHRVDGEQKSTLARELRSQFDSELAGNVQGNQLFPLLDVFTDLINSGAVDTDDGERTVERLTSLFEGSNLNNNQVANLIETMAEFNEYYGKEEQTLSRLSNALSNTNHNRIQNSGKKLIDAIEDTGNVPESTIQDTRNRIR